MNVKWIANYVSIKKYIFSTIRQNQSQLIWTSVFVSTYNALLVQQDPPRCWALLWTAKCGQTDGLADDRRSHVRKIVNWALKCVMNFATFLLELTHSSVFVVTSCGVVLRLMFEHQRKDTFLVFLWITSVTKWPWATWEMDSVLWMWAFACESSLPSESPRQMVVKFVMEL